MKFRNHFRQIIIYIIVASFIIQLAAPAISYAQTPDLPLKSLAQNTQTSGSSGEVKADFITDAINSIIQGIAGLLGLTATTTESAECADTLSAVSGTPNPTDENRKIGKGLGCGAHDLVPINISGNLKRIIMQPIKRDLQGNIIQETYDVLTSLIPAEEGAGAKPGPGCSSTTPGGCTGSDKKHIRGYVDPHSMKEVNDKDRFDIKDNVPDWQIISTAGPTDKISPYMCGDKECQIVRREEAARKMMLGYWYSINIPETCAGGTGVLVNGTAVPDVDQLPNVNCGEKTTALQYNNARIELAYLREEKGIDATIDSTLGFLHSKSVRLGAAISGYMHDTAVSSVPLGIKGEMPFYGIQYWCQKGLSVPGIDVGLLCRTVVGPNYAAGELATDGLLCRQLVATGLSKESCLMASCGDNCDWAIPAPAAGSGLCEFSKPETYITFLKQLKGLVHGAFYALAGPNEPNTEKWAGATPADVATYMNAIIAGGTGVSLLSPAFNMTYPGLESEIAAMKAAKANFGGLAGIAGNAYNAGGEGVSHWVDRLQKAFSATGLSMGPLYLTETGNYDTNDLGKLSAELSGLAGNSAVQAMNLFNAFGTNGAFNSKNYNLDDGQIRGLCPDGNCGGKLGVNFAGIGDLAGYERAAALGMKYMVEISSNDPAGTAKRFNDAIGKGLTPILRVCYAGQAVGEPTAASTIIPVEYFKTPRGVIYNSSTEKIDDPDWNGKETVTLDKADWTLPSNISNYTQFREKDQNGVYTDNVLRNTIGADTASMSVNAGAQKFVAKHLLPFELAKDCFEGDEYKQTFPLEYDDEAMEQSINGTVSDARPLLALPEGGTNGREYAVVKYAVPIPAAYRAAPAFPVEFVRSLSLQLGVNKTVEEGIRSSSNKSCGFGKVVLPYEIAASMEKPLNDKGMTGATLPTKSSTLVCSANSNCSLSDQINVEVGGPDGGQQLVANTCIGPDCVCGTTAASFMPYGTCQKDSKGISVSGKIYAMAQEAEKQQYAKAPWTELSSYNRGDNALKEISSR